MQKLSYDPWPFNLLKKIEELRKVAPEAEKGKYNIKIVDHHGKVHEYKPVEHAAVRYGDAVKGESKYLNKFMLRGKSP